RTVSHPLPPAMRVKRGHELFRLGKHRFRPLVIRRQIEAPEFHRTADAHPGLQGSDHKSMAAKYQLTFQIECSRRQGRVVTALGFQRDPVAKADSELMRPCPRRDDDVRGFRHLAPGQIDSDALFGWINAYRIRFLEGCTKLACVSPQSLSYLLRIADG